MAIAAGSRGIASRSRKFFALALVGFATVAALAQNNVVYVESNVGQTTNQNSVYAFVNNGGKLTQLKGSPYLTQGTGVFSSNPVFAPGFQADQEIVTNAAGTLLFAVNGHSDTITTFNINSDGSLTLANVSGSNGADPVSLGLDETPPSGTVMTVINQDADPGQAGGTPNATDFFVTPAGDLTAVSNSTINYPASSVPAQALVSPSGRFVFVVQFMGGGALTSYDVGAGGRLVLNNALIPSKGSVFLGAAANAKQRAIYVGLPDVNMVGTYTYSTAGVIAFSHLTPNPGLQVCWMTSNKAGTRLYTTETNSNSVTVYDITGANFTKPKELQHLPLLPGGLATNAKIDPTGAYLYVLGLNDPPGGVGNFLHVLNISSSDGTVTETVSPTAIPVPSGEVPQGIAVALK
jgi:6-phosphogluconolactonase (cycloisomerase 2 family)